MSTGWFDGAGMSELESQELVVRGGMTTMEMLGKEALGPHCPIL